MQFDQFCFIMRTHGINMLAFRYHDSIYIVSTKIDWQHLSYFFSLWTKTKYFPSTEDFDTFITYKFFAEKTLGDIWDSIEILSIDGQKVDEYDPSKSFDFVNWKKEMGELQWEHSLSRIQTYFVSLKYVCLGALPFPILSILLPLLGQSNWYFVLFVGVISLLPLIIFSIVFPKMVSPYHYQITTKKIMLYNGLSYDIDYKNIRKIKLKKSIFGKQYGTVKLYFKKGFSKLMPAIPNAKAIYQLILNNLNKNNKSSHSG